VSCLYNKVGRKCKRLEAHKLPGGERRNPAFAHFSYAFPFQVVANIQRSDSLRGRFTGSTLLTIRRRGKPAPNIGPLPDAGPWFIPNGKQRPVGPTLNRGEKGKCCCPGTGESYPRLFDAAGHSSWCVRACWPKTPPP